MIAGAVLAAAVAATPLQVGTRLDCARGYDALVADIRARPNLKAYGADPLLDTWQDSSLNLYAATKPGHAAHPAVVKRTIQQSDKVWVETSSCGYGDKAAFDAMMATFDQLNAALAAQFR